MDAKVHPYYKAINYKSQSVIWLEKFVNIQLSLMFWGNGPHPPQPSATVNLGGKPIIPDGCLKIFSDAILVTMKLGLQYL